MKRIERRVLRDSLRFEELVQGCLEGDAIGELCREGKRVFYACWPKAGPDCLYLEGPTRLSVATKMARKTLEQGEG